MHGSLDRISPNSRTNRSSLEIGNPNETTPLTGAKATNPTSTGFWSCFSGLSAGASRLGNRIAAYCSPVTKPILSAYHFVVDKLNQNGVSYSEGTTTMSDFLYHQYTIPKEGTFIAGTGLLRELGSTVSMELASRLKKSFTLKELKNQVESLDSKRASHAGQQGEIEVDASIKQFLDDCQRSTFKIKNQGDADFQPLVAEPADSGDKAKTLDDIFQKKKSSFEALIEFTGGAYDLHVSRAIATIYCQTLATKSNNCIGDNRKDFVMGEPAKADSPQSKFTYSLEKQAEGDYILTYHEEGSTDSLVEKKGDNANILSELNKKIDVMRSHSWRIRKNEDFNNKSQITTVNLPVCVECLDYEAMYAMK